MPRPSPSSPWQGVQKIRKRSWPRSSTARSTGNGSVSASLPAVLPVVKSSAGRAALLSRIAARNRARDQRPRRSAVVEEVAGLVRLVAGWSYISLRQPRRTTSATRPRSAATSAPAPACSVDRSSCSHLVGLILGSPCLEATSFRRAPPRSPAAYALPGTRAQRSASNNGSRACRQRKNRLRDARAKLGTLKTG